MVKIGNTVVYRDEICTVADILEKYKDDEDYYVLSSVLDASLRIKVSVRRATEVMRPLITKAEIKALISRIPDIKTLPASTWNRGLEYKELLHDGSLESIVCIIKTVHLRQQEKVDNKQKPSDSDKMYFRQAEKLFYNEVAASLGVGYDEAKAYITQEVAALGVEE